MDMTPSLAPKSNQLNSDDLITGPRTITITSVVAGNAEQPVAVHFDGDQGKPWYPAKSMRRVLVAAWGADASQYVGRSLTLFRDPEVSYGGIKVGGIRISHLSHLDNPLSIALTVTRQKRAPYKVLPLATRPAAAVAPAAQAKAPAPEAVSPVVAARAACLQAGLTEAGITALCEQIGEVANLDQLPSDVLERIIEYGISAETVARCNGGAAEPEPEPDPDDDEPPAAWAA